MKRQRTIARCAALLTCLAACEPADAARDVDAASPDCWPTPEPDSSGHTYELPAPRGRFGVGRGVRRTLIDPVRPEPLTSDPDDRRQVTIELYYPITACSSAEPAAYLDDAEGAALWSMTNADDDWWKAVRTHSALDAPMVDDDTRHPVLLLSPGHGGWVRLNAAYIEELVSHGYVVAAISHTYWGFTVLADGTGLPALAPQDPLDAATYAEQTHVWIADQRLVLDTLEHLDADDPAGEVTGRLDLAHVGALGYSFGGSSSVNLLAEDDRIAAAFDLDGTIHLAPRANKPALLLLSQHSLDPTWRQFVADSTGETWVLEVLGAKHGDFDDTGVISSQAEYPLDPVWYGSIDKPRALRLVEDYALAFFDRFLRNGDGALLDAEETPPEVLRLDLE